MNAQKILFLPTVMIILVLAGSAEALAQGPADELWNIYKEGRFEEVVSQGQALLNTQNETAQVNLAVGRSLVHLEKYEDSLPYLTKAVTLDPAKTWVFAWAQVYLGSVYWEQRNDERARQAWIVARDCQATRNATRNAENNLNYLGLSEFFDDWDSFETEHFSFGFSNRLVDFDRVVFARRHEEAYALISQWFGGGTTKKIRFLLWSSQAEADEMGIPTLGFSKPRLHLTHAIIGQTVGHEMTHIISHDALQPVMVTGLINEGVAVHLDQTGRDQMARAKALRKEAGPEAVRVSVPAMWVDWSLAPEVYSYALAGALVKMLLDKGGKDRFFEFFTDQSYEHAQEIYGPDLTGWIDHFEAELYSKNN